MKRLTAWLAICAILIASFAPTIAQAVHSTTHASPHLTEICHTPAAAGEVSDRPANDGHHAPADHTEHCPFCRIYSDLPVLPPASNQLVMAAGTRTVYPDLFYLSPRPLFMWASAQPRAPPLIS